MWTEAFQKWDGRGVFLLRLDYGYGLADVGEPRLEEAAVDLERLPLDRIEERLRSQPVGAGVHVVQAADRLAALGRRKGGEELWGALAHASASGGILLVARFPRVAWALDHALRDRGLWAGSAENPASGELPPLYSRLSAGGELFALHLALEWETGVARARAATVLVEAGALMAARGIVSPAQLALGLGGTAGAARSYLTWMADAGLARRASGGFALRHPALGALFEATTPLPMEAPPTALRDRGGAPPVLAPRPSAPAPAPRWDPSELD